jgi:uncharacterized protein YggL (DUF469 family)
MQKKINPEEFNRMAFAILAKYSHYIGIPVNEIQEKINQFSKQLIKENEESIQQRQNDDTSNKSI